MVQNDRCEPKGRAAGDGASRGSRPGLRPAPAYVFLTTGAAAAVAAAAGVFGAAGPVVVFAIGLATLVVLAGSVWRYRPSRLWPWAAIAAAFVVFLASAIARDSMQTVGDLTASRSLLPDLLVLPGYGLLAMGLLGFARQGIRDRERQSAVVLEGLLGALALAGVAWVCVVHRVLVEIDMPVPVMLVMIAYPSLPVFMVVVTLHIILDPCRERTPAVWFLFAGMAFMFLGDGAYVVADLGLSGVPGPLLDLPYALGFLCAGACTLHPTMRGLTEPGREGRPNTSRSRIALVAVALLIPAVLTLADRGTSLAERAALSALMLAMTATAVLRLVQALRTAERSESRLVHQAHYDGLTGLPNRRMMEARLAQLLRRAPVDRTHVALLYLDLDRFKLVNDTLGHSHGDDLLVEVADRLRRNVRPSDLVTRIGGDEFMVVLNHVVSVSEAVDLANRLRACLATPFVVKGMTFYVSASIGLAFASGEDPQASAEVLIGDADTAMYQAKDAGRNAVAVFDESMRTAVTERVELEHDLRHAIARREMHLVYQPIVNLPAGNVVGMEALVRWAHPRHGVISPAKFIPLAEDSGMIGTIGDWVLEESLSQLAAWKRHWPHMESLYLSMNLSGVQLHDAIVQRVADALAINRLDGASLCLELTESVVLEDPAATARILEELRRLDVRLAIDDFGSQYSSLAYLRRFPVTMLKIDKSFVDTLGDDDSPDATLIASIMAMAHALEIATVAEGVEREEQAAHLRALGCDGVQGYLYSRPVGADRLPEVVASLDVPRLRLVSS